MKYVRLGNTGMEVSRICLGTMSYGTPKWREWVLDEAASMPFFRRALELGINFFDTANQYSQGVSEEVTGKALREYARREEVVLATKVYFPMGERLNNCGLSRKNVMESIDASLRRLGTDYVDLYQIHRWDYETPIEETLEALHDVVKAGKARYIGASSMFAWQFSKALYTSELRGWSRFITMQNHYNLLYREEEREMIPLCRDQKIGIIPWSPLGRGLLSRKQESVDSGTTSRGKTDHNMKSWYAGANLEIANRNAEVAERLGYKPAQTALAWLLSKPYITAPIIGATKMDYLDDAAGALDIELSADDVTYLEELYRPQEIAGHGLDFQPGIWPNRTPR